MRAVLVATGECPDMSALTRQYPTPMLPLLNRPFIHHVVEHLVEQGVTRIDFVLSNLPEKIEGSLGDGTRWGADFRYHLARDASHPYNLLRNMDLGDNTGAILIGHADRLPDLPLRSMPPTAGQTVPAAFCCSRAEAGEDGLTTEGSGRDDRRSDGPPPTSMPEHPAKRGMGAVALAEPVSAAHVEEGISPPPRPAPGRLDWTGWAMLSREEIASLPANLDETGFEAHILELSARESSVVSVAPPLCMRSYDDILSSHRRALSGDFKGLMHSAREVEEGILLSRNVTIHPTVKLIPPVFIGENCRISIGTQLGPNATIGNDCVIDSRCLVNESIVFPGSFVGEALELEGSIVDRNRLINARIGTDVVVPESFILGSLSDHDLGKNINRILVRTTATVMLGLFLPLLAVTALFLKVFRKGPVFHRKKIVALPSSPDEAQWRTFDLLSFRPHSETALPGLTDFLLRFLPALGNVGRGEIGFAGLPPRTREEVADLPGDWKDFYIPSQVGIVTEADILGIERSCDYEHYTVEAFYAVNTGVGYNLKLLARYFGQVLFGKRK
jgi:NDP-sugar pyrophosphorylase family protein